MGVCFSANDMIDHDFYTLNFYCLPKWVVDHENLTLLQAVTIMNYRNSDRDNLKPEELKIDALG